MREIRRHMYVDSQDDLIRRHGVRKDWAVDRSMGSSVFVYIPPLHLSSRVEHYIIVYPFQISK